MKERLQKLISQAGVASRRHAEEMILNGEVTVNGEIAALGAKADPATDHIKVRGKLINTKLENRENVYILLNKPKGFLSSVSDPENRRLVTDLVPESLGKLYPVGRLDYSTEGLIILTNDGEFTNFVTSAKNKIPKTYEVRVKGLPNDKLIENLRRGIRLEDGFRTAPCEIRLIDKTENNAWYEVTLIQGHNQQIRKMFDAIHHSVSRLRRISIAHIKIEKMPLGAYRLLAPHEIRQFTHPIRKPVVKPKTVLKPRERAERTAAKSQERIQPKERVSPRDRVQPKARTTQTRRAQSSVKKPTR
ncbi:MAG: pseudouridine synthase [Pyrinomonadaceae bacterium]